MGKARKSLFTLQAYWFPNSLNIIRKQVRPVPDLATFRRLIRPYRRRQSIALYLKRDDFATGGVLAHFTGLRAWVCHYDCPGGIYSHAYDADYRGPREGSLGFRLDNGQVDDIHPSWTVSRAAGIRALEYFLGCGDRDPASPHVGGTTRELATAAEKQTQ